MKFAIILQRLLDRCERWYYREGLNWSLKGHGVSQTLLQQLTSFYKQYQVARTLK